jgi:hypothetical protein
MGSRVCGFISRLVNRDISARLAGGTDANMQSSGVMFGAPWYLPASLEMGVGLEEAMLNA